MKLNKEPKVALFENLAINDKGELIVNSPKYKNFRPNGLTVMFNTIILL